jgi:hypothetical protein
MSKEQEGLIELVGQEYTKWFYDNAEPSVSGKPILNGEGILTRGEFINKIKTNPEFSERWGLKIEERELSLEERRELVSEDIARGRVLDRNGLNQGDFGDISPFTEKIIHYWMNQFNIPTKLITITYNNDKTIESYE